MRIEDIHLNLDIVLSKECSLGYLLSLQEIRSIENIAEKNGWTDNDIIDYVTRKLKENIKEYLDYGDFLDSVVILESDPFIIKAMQLMSLSQRHMQVLLLDKEDKYPDYWVNRIACALNKLQCKREDYAILVNDAYFTRNYEKNKDIPGWTELQEVLEEYYDSL